jgi:hypothetical protein
MPVSDFVRQEEQAASSGGGVNYPWPGCSLPGGDVAATALSLVHELPVFETQAHSNPGPSGALQLLPPLPLQFCFLRPDEDEYCCEAGLCYCNIAAEESSWSSPTVGTAVTNPHLWCLHSVCLGSDCLQVFEVLVCKQNQLVRRRPQEPAGEELPLGQYSNLATYMADSRCPLRGGMVVSLSIFSKLSRVLACRSLSFNSS